MRKRQSSEILKRNRSPKYDGTHGTATAFIRYGKETKKRQGSEI
jgi:hypothetical protein